MIYNPELQRRKGGFLLKRLDYKGRRGRKYTSDTTTQCFCPSDSRSYNTSGGFGNKIAVKVCARWVLCTSRVTDRPSGRHTQSETQKWSQLVLLGSLVDFFFFLVFSEEHISFVANIRLTNENETVTLDKVFLLQFLVSMPNSPTFPFSNLLLYNAVYLYLCVWCVCVWESVCVCVSGGGSLILYGYSKCFQWFDTLSRGHRLGGELQ